MAVTTAESPMRVILETFLTVVGCLPSEQLGHSVTPYDLVPALDHRAASISAHSRFDSPLPAWSTFSPASIRRSTASIGAEKVTAPNR